MQPKDIRNFFMLPQAPEDAGYYVYGTPGNGAAGTHPLAGHDNHFHVQF
jgi:hypothetical protein